MHKLIIALGIIELLAPAVVLGQTIPPTTGQTTGLSGPATASASEEVIVTGTRQQGRTRQQSPAPIDVISAAELRQTGQQNVFDALNKILPSLDLPGFGFDTAGLVRSARLRGLSPDDTLVLVDGKRRHVSANINADIGPVGGSDPVDLDMIPISLIDHIEVLRDGAAAQYGSDAIAGVINIILKHADHGGDAFAQEGATYVGDGFTNNIGTSIATKLGDAGYFDAAFDYTYHDHTSRTGPYPQDTGPIPVSPDVSHIEGDPRYNLINFGINAGYQAGDTTLYSFATYGYRHAESFENFRDPNIAGAYETTPGAPFGNLTAAVYYPNGFEPLEALNEDDYSLTVGDKGMLPGDFHYDISSTYGGDIDNVSTLNSVNPSYLQQFGSSPLHFHAGEFNDTEWTNNLDITKPVDVPIFAAPLNVAFGGEFRRNTYQLEPGDYPSQYGGGAQAYPGFTDASAGYYQRENEAGYIDLATYPLPHWQVEIAGRFEHYSDVGNTETGKVTSRYDFTPQFGIRGTISNGFRAPTLAQEGFAAVNVAPTFATGQFPVNSTIAKDLGSSPLKAERSNNYSVGFVATPIARMHLEFDLYQIDIRDQIEDSGLFQGTTSGIPGVGANIYAQFYTNGIKTRTRGADSTLDYLTPLPNDTRINWLLAANFNDVEIVHIVAKDGFTPDVLSEIQEATPKNKIVLQAIYHADPFSLTLRETRYGQVVEVLADGESGSTPFTANRNKPQFIADIEIGYKVTPHVTFTIGADNVFDTYASRTTADARYHNAQEYIASSPYGIDGGFYYGRVGYNF